MHPISLRGARTHNLKDVDLDLGREGEGTLIVVAGVAGAGKSSLAMDTLYAEGQRRYVESFSAYARQFLERLPRPPVTRLEPVPAAIAVDRCGPVRTSRSTVGTMTEVTDYVRSLFATSAALSCPRCGRAVTRDTPTGSGRALADRHPGRRVTVTYKLAVGGVESLLGVRDALLADGYRRVLVGGVARDLDTVRPTEITSGELHVVADRTTTRSEDHARLVEALEAAMSRGAGRVDAHIDGGPTVPFSSGLHCAFCDVAFSDSTPGLFSFNSPVGACPACRGFGRTIEIDFDRVLPDATLSIRGGVIKPWKGKGTEWERGELLRVCKRFAISPDTPWDKLPQKHRDLVIYGEPDADWSRGEWPGVSGWFSWMESRAYKMHVRVLLSRYRRYETCRACSGSRLRPEALFWKIGGLAMSELLALPAERAAESLAGWMKTDAHGVATHPVASTLARELSARLEYLCRVGLGYLTLDRASRTLSGGEGQRTALASALGATLTGALLVLDEPTVGLHPADVRRMVSAIRDLATAGNLVVVVDNDADVIAAADRVIELGPGAGAAGGSVVFDGAPHELRGEPTPTGAALAGDLAPAKSRRARPTSFIHLRGARGNNLRGVDVRFARGGLTVVTGPSGSGKSSLVSDTLYPAAARALGVTGLSAPLPFDSIRGLDGIPAVVLVDQSPLGRTSRGNAGTYLKVLDDLRHRFAAEPDSERAGLAASSFSFNVDGGRCEACRGEGSETIEMQLLADVSFPCIACGGKRFKEEVLRILHRGKSIGDVMAMTAAEVAAWLAESSNGSRDPSARRLAPLLAVGLGYLPLGQPLNTLSGGESQRLKLAAALATAAPGSLVVLDEPSVGLHPADVLALMTALETFIARGDTLVTVEHDISIAACADHIVDLGPGAGDLGGEVVAEGPPDEIAKSKTSVTAPFLAAALAPQRRPAKSSRAARGVVTAPSNAARQLSIRVEGASEHNLRAVSVDLPRESLIVVTGPSGSGKSTLAFDVVYAEGQRRYLQTLSPYARQYLPQLPRPNVDRVVGVPPSISLEQRLSRAGGRSTVATVTEVAHYLRLLWARAGTQWCPTCNLPVVARDVKSMLEDARARGGKREISVLAPVIRKRKGHHGEIFDRALRDGITRARVDGEVVTIEPGKKVARYAIHDIELVVGTARAADPALGGLLDRARRLGDGTVGLLAGGDVSYLSSHRACPSCGRGFPEADPRLLSFNTPEGRCPTCEGHGTVERTKRRRGRSASSVRVPCTDCAGSRLSPLARAVRLDGRSIDEVLALSVSRASEQLRDQTLGERETIVAGAPLAEVGARLDFLESVGLGYLALDRAAGTLSGGELQRLRLAAQLGSGLTGALYVLDEPTIGLHPRDTGRLLGALRKLVGAGSTVLVVEHDSETIRAADHLVDLGPGGGREGGCIVFEGPPSLVTACDESATGRALRNTTVAHLRARPTDARSAATKVFGARANNLGDIDAAFPSTRLTCVTGVSGSGKSTLVRSVLYRAARRALDLEADEPGTHDRVEVDSAVRRVLEVDQSPIGRTPRSVPATYVGVWDDIRALLAQTPDARARGWDASRFSFNVAGGRCEGCGGQGANVAEMSFLPDVSVPCEACGGGRFAPETLQVQLSGHSVAQILALTAAEASRLFASFPRVARPLTLMCDLGLGYLSIGQASNTLSGGEAQRIKLVAELATSSSSGTLYVLDEPTTGLHLEDVGRLVDVLQRLVDRGDTVIVIEHHPDVIAAADWIVDLGPEGGEHGGRIVVAGTPAEVARCAASHTGAVLRERQPPAAVARPRRPTRATLSG